MLTIYVVNRMHRITVCFCLCFEFGTNRLREALTVLKRPVDHRSHILHWLPRCSEKFSLGTHLCISLVLI